MIIYLIKYIVAKQNVYHMKELSSRKNVHICAQHVCFKRARFQVSYRFIRLITCNLRGSPYRRNLGVIISMVGIFKIVYKIPYCRARAWPQPLGRVRRASKGILHTIFKSVAMIFSYPYFSKSEYVI